MGMPNWNRRNNFGFDEDEVSYSQTDCSTYVRIIEKLRYQLVNKNKQIKILKAKFKREQNNILNKIEITKDGDGYHKLSEYHIRKIK